MGFCGRAITAELQSYMGATGGQSRGCGKSTNVRTPQALCDLTCTTSVAEIAANGTSPQNLPTACACSFMLLETVLNVPVTIF